MDEPLAPFWAYPEPPSQESRLASEAAERGDARSALLHASKAAASLDLWHPEGWHSWTLAPDELALRALALMDPREAPRAAGALNFHLRDIAYCFASKPSLLAAMREAGIGVDGARSFIGPPVEGQGVHPALALAFEGDAAGIVGLIEASFAPPGPMSPAQGKLFHSRSAPRSLLHLLAASGRFSESAPGELAAICSWAGPAEINLRDHQGRTPLLIALAACSLHMARALLDAGANPELADSKGNDAAAILARLSRPGMAVGFEREIQAFEARLSSRATRRELDAATPSAEPGRKLSL